MADDRSALVQRISAHFRNLAVRQIEVPEWGESPDQPLIVYAKPMNVMAAEQIFKAGQYGMFIEAMIQLACDESGKPLWTIADKPQLRRAAPREIVERLGLELIRARDADELSPSHEDRIKN